MNHNIKSVSSLLFHIDNEIIPFLTALGENTSCYEHLTYLGAATIEYTGSLPNMYEEYAKNYKAIFSKGNEFGDFETILVEDEKVKQLIMPCLQYSNLYQVAVLNDNKLDESCARLGISDEVKGKLLALINKSAMTIPEVKSWLLEQRPALKKLFDVWEKTRLHQMFLTTVGIALAQANFQRRTGIELALNSWVK